MSEFEDKINSLLNDPEQMDKIAALAKSLMGGEEQSSADKSAKSNDMDGFDPAMLGKIAGLLKNSGARESEQTALLNAMKPYLSEKRREKMDKAMKLAKFAEIAELAADEFGGDDDV